MSGISYNNESLLISAKRALMGVSVTEQWFSSHICFFHISVEVIDMCSFKGTSNFRQVLSTHQAHYLSVIRNLMWRSIQILIL